ncbi:hypothetical protein [Bradyrhizobium sp. BR 10289]|uniref:hypothetical protein n=1 Tax=Bradyrhizobium sp. BR 10289 TaxID=2749993 RepID=UPI001E444B9D|nr:hypothetical protein [Bradyrhizobium sp. BR 10289]
MKRDESKVENPPDAAVQYLTWAIEEIERLHHPDAARHARIALDALANGYRNEGETTISPPQRRQRALNPTISHAGSSDTIARLHLGQEYAASSGRSKS